MERFVLMSRQELAEMLEECSGRVVERLQGQMMKAAGECEPVDAISARFGIPKAALNAMRRKGEGPAYIKKGNLLLYRISDVKEWLDEYRIEPELI